MDMVISSSPPLPLVSTEELRTFHHIDRKLFSRLVTNLQKDFIQSMQVISFWFWLEDFGHPQLIADILPLADEMLCLIYNEALRCLNTLLCPSHLSSSNFVILSVTITQDLTCNEIKDILITHTEKVKVLRRIYLVVKNLCYRIFDDIVEQTMLREEKESEDVNGLILQFHRLPVIQETIWTPRLGTKEVTIGSSFFGSGNHRSVSSQHPLLQGRLDMGGNGMSTTTTSIASTSNEVALIPQQTRDYPIVVTKKIELASSLNPMAEPFGAPRDNNGGERVEFEEVPPEDRTMFFTFSRGYPITLRELRAFFNNLHGDNCIEDIQMQEVTEKRQPLFARVIFRSAAVVAAILGGKDRAKYVINGKHVWTRIFVDKATDGQSSG